MIHDNFGAAVTLYSTMLNLFQTFDQRFEPFNVLCPWHEQLTQNYTQYSYLRERVPGWLAQDKTLLTTSRKS